MNSLPIFPSSESKSLGTPEQPWDAVYAKKYYGIDGNEASSLLPGMIVPFAGNASGVPVGYLLCDGSAVSRTDYAVLFEVIGTTYGAGDGSTTFNLPNLIDRFVEGSATSGTYKEAGLPNITGHGVFCCEYNLNGNDSSGAISLSYYGIRNSGSSSGGTRLTFDASKSNSIYGASDTVQPNALTMRYIIKY